MPTPAQRKQRRQALMAARIAVRAYARDPSPANAHNVTLAWRRVREIDSVAHWRLPGGVTMPSRTDGRAALSAPTAADAGVR